MKNSVLLYTLVFVIGGSVAMQASERTRNSFMREGVEAYREGRFQRADSLFELASSEDPHYAEAVFNKADALFRSNDMKQAAELFRAVTSMSDNKQLVGQAWHNLGNCFAQQEQWKEAVDAYKHSLRTSPTADTKYNLSYALKKLKDQQNQDQQNQDQQNQDQQNQDQQNQDQQNQDQQNQDQQNQDQQNQDQQNQDQQNQDQQNQNQQNQDQQNQDQQNQNQQNQDQQNQDQQDGQTGDKQSKDQQAEQNGSAMREAQISQEEAQKMIQALNRAEATLQRKLQKRTQSNKKSEKDW